MFNYGFVFEQLQEAVKEKLVLEWFSFVLYYDKVTKDSKAFTVISILSELIFHT